jgi:hypothetical protein
MAERIVSPGVFTNEKDLSFLPQGIDGIGAALIGPTLEGPAFTPTIVRNFAEFETIFGKESQDFYVPFAAKQYLRSAGAVTIVRVLGLGGYKNDTVLLGISGSNGVFIGASLKPSRGATDPDALELAGPHSASLNAGGTMNSFVMNLATTNGLSSASRETFTLSFNSSSANYITKVFSSDPQDANQEVYVYKNFLKTQNLMTTSDKVFIASGSDENFGFDYDFASTPSIQSQLVNGTRTSLFKVKTRSHGSSQNEAYKVGISNIKQPADVPGSDYGAFDLQVIVNNPGQNDDNTVLENFQGLNFDEDSVNYLPRKIGDRYVSIDSNGKLTNNGDYPNQSKYVYVSNFGNLTGISKDLVPMGFAALVQPHVLSTTSQSMSGSTVDASYPTASYRFTTSGQGQKNSRGTFDSNEYYGFDFKNEDNKQYLGPTPTSAANGNNVTMSLEDAFGNNDASTLGSSYSVGAVKISVSGSAIQQKKFAVPFQGGFDGMNPAIEKKNGTNTSLTNTFGFDFTDANSSGSVAFKRAINAISNPDEFDINLLAVPGIIHGLGGGHQVVTNHAIDKVEDRADAFFIMDGFEYNASVQTAISNVQTVDSNYVATYYPWIKILDSVKGKPTWVPPSVVLPGVFAQNDRIGQEWFAPAGLNRGGLTEVLEAKTRLTNLERDDLYENRINPIASFPGQGVVVFGQKTLQGKPSALDRINVRRLLINLRKFIASTSRFLVFEQNTSTLRTRFLNLVNPYLEQVQSNSGLNAFRIVMDETNNTPDVVDRNQLVGQIFIQPTKTAEFIVLDFVVQPSGAAFED